MTSRRVALFSALMLFVVAPAVAEDEVAGLKVPMQCSGNEPAWALIITDAKHATYIWDNQPTPWKVVSVGHAAQRPTTWLVTFAGRKRQAFIFDEGQQSCSDNDGDNPLAYGLLLQDGNAVFRGCCNPKE
jgi:uncharacterized membrane protein